MPEGTSGRLIGPLIFDKRTKWDSKLPVSETTKHDKSDLKVLSAQEAGVQRLPPIPMVKQGG
jgi:hypothetical protein